MFTSTPFLPRDGDESQSGAVGGFSVRQSMSRGRMSFAYPTQQVFEETRSILHDGGRSVAEPSEFEVTLERKRRMSMMPARGNEDYMEVMESLHQQFLITIQSMTDVSQIFSVIGGWIEDLQIAMQCQKTNQTDISDANYRKLRYLLQKEVESWSLISRLYFERLNVNEDGSGREPFSEEIRDRFCINEEPYVQAIIETDPLLREMEILLDWLQTNFQKNDLPDLSEKFFIWENTLEALKRDRLLNKPTSKAMVTNVDPDAPTREGKQLHPLDDEENNKVLRGAFYYLRTGDPEAAIAYLAKSGEKIKAAALSGYRFTVKTQIDQETGEEQGAQRHAVLPSMEYLPKSKRQARPNPDYDIRGNEKRDKWKSVTWKVCEKNVMSKYDRALLGTLCGHRQAMLDVSQNWEDRLWAFLKTSFDVTVEGALRGLTNPNYREVLPDSYWSQKLSVSECIEKVEAFGRSETMNTPEYIFQLLQKCVMMNKMDKFVEELQSTIGELMETYDHSLLKGHLIRFLSHMILFLAFLNLPHNQELVDICMENYISVLVDINQFTRIPYYVQMITEDKRIPLIVHHINPEHKLEREEVIDFLQAACSNQLDVLNIGISVVDKMRDEEGDFDVENLNWISSCYDILDKSPQVMLELLKYTIWISRKYLTLGNTGKVQQLIGRLTAENVREVGQLSENLENTLVREYICYKVYLAAEEALSLWMQVLSQKPAMDMNNLPTNATGADRTVFEKRKNEQEAVEQKWRGALNYHLNTAIQKFLDILKFPDGWLRECYDPLDEDEAIHVGAVRRIVIKKVVNILLRLVKDKSDNRTIRDFIYVVCDDKRNILRELSPNEIGNIFKVVEKFTRNKVSDIMFLPK